MERGFSLCGLFFSARACGTIVDSVGCWDETLGRFWFATDLLQPGGTISTAESSRGPCRLRFPLKFPLFRGAYCYYWFYMFFIWYKE